MDSAHYPNWLDFISQLRAKGIKTPYINCLLSSNIEDRGTPFQSNFYKEALASGYLVRNSDGSVWTGYSNSSLIDISNPKAYAWTVDIIVKVSIGGGENRVTL